MAHVKSFRGDFKQFFGRGLAILLPSIVTLWLLFQAFSFVFSNVAEPINRFLRRGVIWTVPVVLDQEDWPGWYAVTDRQVRLRAARQAAEGFVEPSEKDLRRQIRLQQFREVWHRHWYLRGLGLVVAIVLIYLAGLLLGNYLGRRLYVRVEQLISRIPGFKQVYPYVKQVVDLVFGENSTMKAFREVVLVEYPRKGIWSMGFVTSSAFSAAHEVGGSEMVTVFIATSPTPMTGYVVLVRREDVRRVDVSIDQALRFIITAGMLTPDDRDGTDARPGTAEAARIEQARAEAVRKSSPAPPE